MVRPDAPYILVVSAQVLNTRKTIMIEIDTSQVDNGIVRVKILGKIERDDFEKHLAPVADHVIEEQGKITGLLIDVTEFGGWDGLSSLLEHLKFVKHHHKHVQRLAVVGNHTWQEFLPKIARLFVNAELKYFDQEKQSDAETWVGQPHDACCG